MQLLHRMRARSNPAGSGGFTRLDLLALIGMGLFLLLLSRPVLGNPSTPRNVVCLDNLRRLATAWLMYTDDHRGWLVANYHGGAVSGGTATDGWASGWLDWSTAPANTNTLFLTSDRYSALAQYNARDPYLFWCPANGHLSVAQAARGWTRRARSYAMNFSMGRGNSKDIYPGQAIYSKLSDLKRLPPAGAMVFLEEHPDSVNDGAFLMNISQPMWVDMPASFHDAGATFAFGDGHVELHAWRSTRTLLPVRTGQFTPPPLPVNDPDYLWMRDRFGERQ